MAGTIIEKTVSLGTVITSATGAFGGGTTLLKMADLSQVRVRALFNETDIGQVRPGQTATVTVDAYPDRRFTGIVEKIEPQAVIQQNVTMFPVLVNLENGEGLLKPGMNGETSVLVDQRSDVLVRAERRRAQPARGGGHGADPRPRSGSACARSIAAQMAAQRWRPAAAAAMAHRAGAPAGATATSRGDVALDPQQQGGQGGQGGFQMPDVTDADCAAVTAAFAKKPAEQAKLDGLRAQMTSGAMDRQAMRAESQKIYAAVGVDARVAGACRRKEMMANGGGSPAPGAAQGGRRAQGATRCAGAPGAAAARSAVAAPAPAAVRAARARLNIGGGEMRAAVADAARAPASCSCKKGTTFEPRARAARRGELRLHRSAERPEGRRAGRAARGGGAPGAAPAAE